MLLAPDRRPGDREVAATVQAQVYDVADDLDRLPQLLDHPADFAVATRWQDPSLAPDAPGEPRVVERTVIESRPVPVSRRTCAVVSPKGGVGRTTGAVNLADRRRHRARRHRRDVGPLAGEPRRVLARAALLQDASRTLDECAERFADPDLTALARRLSAAWRLRAPGPDTFAGFGDTLRHIRETHIAARTKTLPVAYVAIAGWMLFALVAIVAVPTGTVFLHSLSRF